MKYISLQKRIFITFSIVFFLLIGFICVILNAYLQEDMIRQKRAYLNTFSASVAQQISSILDNMNDMSVKIYYSRAVRDAFTRSAAYLGEGNYFSRVTSDRDIIDDMLYSVAGTDITDVVINLYNDRAFYSSKYYTIDWERAKLSMQNDGYLARIAERLQASSQPVVTSLDSAYWALDSYKTPAYIALSRNFLNYTTHKSIGKVEVLLPVKFLDRMFLITTSDQTTMLTDAEGNIIYRHEVKGSEFEDIEARLPAIINVSGKDQPPVGDGDIFYGRAAIERYGLNVITFEPRELSDYWDYVLIVILSGLALYAASITACMLISRRLTQPLNHIVDSLREVSWNTLEMNLRLDNRYGDFDVLEQAYKAMMIKLHESIDLVIDSRLNEQKATYLALQSQISPHFLYNVIANISACAYENGVDKIVDICDKLSGLLRYATDYSESLSSIENELEYTQNYLELMKIRYADRFFYSISLAEDCSGFPIPRLITQTVIENCFKHAFSRVPAPWYISVSAYLKDGWWLVDITHNGEGIPEGMLLDILAKSERLYRDNVTRREGLSMGGLGLVNSVTRLRMLCDNEIRFDVFSPDGASSVTRFGGKLK